jgi:hypothetical protein
MSPRAGHARPLDVRRPATTGRGSWFRETLRWTNGQRLAATTRIVWNLQVSRLVGVGVQRRMACT